MRGWDSNTAVVLVRIGESTASSTTLAAPVESFPRTATSGALHRPRHQHLDTASNRERKTAYLLFPPAQTAATPTGPALPTHATHLLRHRQVLGQALGQAKVEGPGTTPFDAQLTIRALFMDGHCSRHRPSSHAQYPRGQAGPFLITNHRPASPPSQAVPTPLCVKAVIHGLRSPGDPTPATASMKPRHTGQGATASWLMGPSTRRRLIGGTGIIGSTGMNSYRILLGGFFGRRSAPQPCPSLIHRA